MEKKICRICKQEKDITEYNFRKENNKYKNECKDCISKYNKKYREKNREKIKQYKKERAKKNKEQIKPKFEDLSNKKLGRLLVIKRVENSRFSTTRWLCKCDCGNELIVFGCHLRSGHTRSCGCISKEIIRQAEHKPKHGLIKTRIYKIWNGIRNRTNIKTANKEMYKNYSGRGIKICDEWKEFINFYNWSMANGYKENLTIDRIDNNGDYEPSNCRWTTWKKQQNNKRNNVIIEFNNEKHTLEEWNDKKGFTKGLIRNRLRRGWSIERALNTPKGKYNGNST